MPSGTFYTFSSPLGIGVKLFADQGRTIPVTNGTYSNGTNCFTIDGGDGIITAVSTCPDPTPTPTATLTPPPTNSPTPTQTPTPTSTPASQEPLFFYAVDEYYCNSIPGVCVSQLTSTCVASTTQVAVGAYYRNTHPDGQGEIFFVTGEIDPSICIVATLENQTYDCNVLCGTIT